MQIKLKELLNNSYAVYSNYNVSCVLETKDNNYFYGVNVENASYGATICAERAAIFKAVSEGKRNFKRIVIVGGYDKVKDFCPPCGVCLQVMSEFCNPETFQIILVKSIKEYKVYTLKELLPKGFGPAQLL